MSFEYGEGSIYHLVAISAPDLHTRGLDVPFSFPLTRDRCKTATAKPLVFLLAFQSQAPLTGRWGDEVVPSGVDRVRLWVLECARQISVYRERRIPEGKTCGFCVAPHP